MSLMKQAIGKSQQAVSEERDAQKKVESVTVITIAVRNGEVILANAVEHPQPQSL